MSNHWTIAYYKLPSGTEPIYDFIQKLPLSAKAKIYNTFELLNEYGIQLGFPHTKSYKEHHSGNFGF